MQILNKEISRNALLSTFRKTPNYLF